MTEDKMIPLSVVDAEINKLSPEYDNDPTYRYTIDILRKIKKEAILIPNLYNGHTHEDSVTNITDIEQKIKDRIKKLEKLNWSNQVIDELRKLLK